MWGRRGRKREKEEEIYIGPKGIVPGDRYLRSPTVGGFAGKSCFKPGCRSEYFSTICESRGTGRVPTCMHHWFECMDYVCPCCNTDKHTTGKDWLFQRPCVECRDNGADYVSRLRYH